MKGKFLSCFFLATFLWSQTAFSIEGQQQKFSSVVSNQAGQRDATYIPVSDGNESVPEDYYYIKKKLC